MAGPGRPGDRPTGVRPDPEPRPALTTAGRHGVSHRLRWLTDQPQVNAEAFELYIASRRPVERSIVDGVPGPWLFLIGRLNRAGLAAEVCGGSLLRVRVGPGAAVDGAALGSRRPVELHHLLAAPDSYLLPVAWLSNTRIVGAYRVDPQGRAHPEELPGELAGLPLTGCSSDARHGAAGLPDDVVYWPGRRTPGAALAYALIPEPLTHPVPDQLTLYRERPRARLGHFLVELDVGSGRAIDIAATAGQLREPPRLRSIAGELCRPTGWS